MSASTMPNEPSSSEPFTICDGLEIPVAQVEPTNGSYSRSKTICSKKPCTYPRKCDALHPKWNLMDIRCVGWCGKKHEAGVMTLKITSLTTRSLYCHSCEETCSKHLREHVCRKCRVMCTNDKLLQRSIGLKHWDDELRFNALKCDDDDIDSKEPACVELAFFQLIVGYEKLTIQQGDCTYPLLQLANNALRRVHQNKFDTFEARARFVQSLRLEDVIGVMMATFTEDIHLGSKLSSKKKLMYNHFSGRKDQSGEIPIPSEGTIDGTVKSLFKGDSAASVKHLRNICAHQNFEVQEDPVVITDSLYELLCKYLGPELFEGDKGSRYWKRLAITITDYDPTQYVGKNRESGYKAIFTCCNLTPYQLYCCCRKFHEAVDNDTQL